MAKLILPQGYKSTTDLRQTQKAIKLIKDTFQSKLATSLNLQRVSAPLFVEENSGLNDDLNGVERPVCFDIKQTGVEAVIVHSLAKWKRMALKLYRFETGTGLYTDMNAIRRDEETDNLHSIYVDQWDWERTINREDRNLDFLKGIVIQIYEAIRRTEYLVCEHFSQLKPFLPEKIHFIHSEELLKLYPNLSPKEREDEICRTYGAVFIMGIGGKLSNGEEHDLRAPDYDDWTTVNKDGYKGLNGDIMIWYPVLGHAVELSSMGIRVDIDSLNLQLELTGKQERRNLYFHKKLLAGELPLSIGGGIGQSRLCMIMLQKAHIGEIQASIWPDSMRKECADFGMPLI